MSEIVGEVGIRIVPITDQFEAQAEQLVLPGLERVEVQSATVAANSAASFKKEFSSVSDDIQASMDSAFKRIESLDFRQQAADIRALVDPEDFGAAFESEILELQKNLTLVSAQEAGLRRQALLAVGEERTFLLTAADAMIVAREKLRAQAAAVQARGPVAPVPVGAPEGQQGPGFTALLGGRSGGALGLAAGAARFGAIGFAAAAAFQTVSKLQQALRTTGEDAFTAEGRMKNFGSALVGADVFGAIDALVGAPKTLEELGVGYNEAVERMEAFDRVANGEAKLLKELALGTETSAEAFERMGLEVGDTEGAMAEYVRIVDQAGTSNQDLAGQGREVGKSFLEIQEEVRKATIELVSFKVAGEAITPSIFAGLVAAAQFQAPPPPDSGTVPGGQAARNQAAEAARQGDLQTQFRLAQQAVAEAGYRLRIVEDQNSKLYKEREEAWQDAKDAADRIGDQIRSAAASDKAAAEAAQKAAREKAAAEAETNAANARTAREQALENQIAKAALTKRKADDESAFAAAIAYWKSLSQSADSALEREEAEAKVLDLRRRRTEFRKGETEAAGHTADELRELQIENRIAAAQLTTGLADDRRFIKQLIDFWRQEVKEAEGFEKEQARSRLIAARLRLQGLDQAGAGGGDSPDVFLNKLFTGAADQFRRFGSNIAATAEDLLSPQDARGRLGAILTTGGGAIGQARAEANQRAQLSEAQKQTQLLQIIAGQRPRRVRVGSPIPKQAEETAAIIGGRILRGL